MTSYGFAHAIEQTLRRESNPWIECPTCEGKGYVHWIESTTGPETCPTCRGHKIMDTKATKEQSE